MSIKKTTKPTDELDYIINDMSIFEWHYEYHDIKQKTADL